MKKTYLEFPGHHACDTCGKPCCGRGFPGCTNWQHEVCEHTNNRCDCGGTVCQSEPIPPGDKEYDPDTDTFGSVHQTSTEN